VIVEVLELCVVSFISTVHEVPGASPVSANVTL
jgi:hypothetical protein